MSITESREPRVRAIRGATTVERDGADEVVAAAAELLAEVLEQNQVSADDIVSVIFTTTPDLTAEFPAVGARRLGLSDVPLLCASEIDVTGAPAHCIRALVHCYSVRPKDEIAHVYLRGARQLRTDLG